MLMRALLPLTAHGTSGAARIRHSLRPLDFGGVRITCKARAQCVARMRRCACGLRIETEHYCRPGLELRCAIAHRGPIRRGPSIRALTLDTLPNNVRRGIW